MNKFLKHKDTLFKKQQVTGQNVNPIRSSLGDAGMKYFELQSCMVE